MRYTAVIKPIGYFVEIRIVVKKQFFGTFNFMIMLFSCNILHDLNFAQFYFHVVYAEFIQC